jgi:hypothetical protein
VVRAMGEGVAVDHEQRATRECELTNSRRTPFPSCPIAGPMGRSLRFRRRGRPAAIVNLAVTRISPKRIL